MTEMIDTVFGDNNTSVEEWYTYAGAPFHFRIAVGTEVTQTSIKEFLNYLNKVKNARSRFDYMAFQNGITLKFFDKSEYQTFFYTFCGDFECGTYPAAAVGFIPTEVQLSLETEGEEAFAEYTPAGTTPDISTGLHLSEVTVDLEGATDGQTIVYPTDSDQETGSYPDPATGLALAESGVSVAPESEGLNLYYDSTAEKYAADEE